MFGSHPRKLGSLIGPVAVHNSAHKYPVIAVLRDVVIQFGNVGVERQRSRGRKGIALIVVAIRAESIRGVGCEGLIGHGIALQDRLRGRVRPRPLRAGAGTGAVGIDQRQGSRCHSYEKVACRNPRGSTNRNVGAAASSVSRNAVRVSRKAPVGSRATAKIHAGHDASSFGALVLNLFLPIGEEEQFVFLNRAHPATHQKCCAARMAGCSAAPIKPESSR